MAVGHLGQPSPNAREWRLQTEFRSWCASGGGESGRQFCFAFEIWGGKDLYLVIWGELLGREGREQVLISSGVGSLVIYNLCD